MDIVQDTNADVDVNDTLPLHVTDHTLPSERFGRRIWLWLAVSGRFYGIHGALLGIGFIVGEHFNVPTFLIAMFYGWLCIQSTSDVYNSISTITHNRNTLLSYLYALALSIGNVGFWVLAIDTSYGSIVILLMIAAGLLTGRWTNCRCESECIPKSIENTYQHRTKEVFHSVPTGSTPFYQTKRTQYSQNITLQIPRGLL